MKNTLLFPILFCTACQTLNVASTGAGYRSENFPKLENRDCIEAALRATEKVEFVARKKQVSEGKTLLKNETRQFPAEVFTYRISTAGGLLSNATYTITDQYSQDGKYEKTSVENQFTPENSGNFTRENKQDATATLAKVNGNVQAECRLPNLRLDLYQK